jgi:hypothetical protein
MSSINDQIKGLRGKNVFIEGVFPLPVGDGRVVYSPAHGKLVEVFDDGVAVVEANNEAPTYFFRENMRSITLAKEASTIVVPKNSLIRG